MTILFFVLQLFSWDQDVQFFNFFLAAGNDLMPGSGSLRLH